VLLAIFSLFLSYGYADINIVFLHCLRIISPMSLVNAPMLPTHYMGEPQTKLQEPGSTEKVTATPSTSLLATTASSNTLVNSPKPYKTVGYTPDELILSGALPKASIYSRNALLGDQLGSPEAQQKQLTTLGVINSFANGLFIWAGTSLLGDVINSTMKKPQADALKGVASSLEASAKVKSAKVPMEAGDAYHRSIIHAVISSNASKEAQNEYLDALSEKLKAPKDARPLVSDFMNGAASFLHLASAETRMAPLAGFPKAFPAILGASIAGVGTYTAIEEGKKAKADQAATNRRNVFILKDKGHDISQNQARQEYPWLYSRVSIPTTPSAKR
jgi:hypothetical protein